FLVVVLVLRQNLHDGGGAIDVGQLDETDQLAVIKCADELTPLGVGFVFSLHRLKILSEMPERLPLANGNFVVNPFDTCHQFGTEWDGFYNDAALCCAPDILPGLLRKSILPPLLE